MKKKKKNGREGSAQCKYQQRRRLFIKEKAVKWPKLHTQLLLFSKRRVYIIKEVRLMKCLLLV